MLQGIVLVYGTVVVSAVKGKVVIGENMTTEATRGIAANIHQFSLLGPVSST